MFAGVVALLIFLSNVKTGQMEAGESQSQSGISIAVSRYPCKSITPYKLRRRPLVTLQFITHIASSTLKCSSFLHYAVGVQ